MLHGKSVFVCIYMCITIQEWQTTSCGSGTAGTCSGAKSMHYDRVTCREAVVIRKATSAATQK